MKARNFSRIVTTLFSTISLAGVAGVRGEPLKVLPTAGSDSALKVSVAGYLVVYTDTESPINVGDIVYYPHTGYKIYDSRGVFVRFVRNHINARDEQPMRVNLPPGSYTVVGKSETQGEVAVPVVINGLRTTVVNLEKHSHAG